MWHRITAPGVTGRGNEPAKSGAEPPMERACTLPRGFIDPNHIIIGLEPERARAVKKTVLLRSVVHHLLQNNLTFPYLREISFDK